MTATSHPVAPLLRIFQEKMLPLLESGGHGKLVVARANRKQLVLPSGVTALPLQRKGNRVAIRSARVFERAAQLAARWPHDYMHELRIPKMMFVVTGNAALRCGNYILQCPPGTMVFLPQGIPHTDGTISHLETLPPENEHCSLLHFTPVISGLACRTCYSTREMHTSRQQGEKAFLHRPQVLQLFYMLAEEIGHEPGEPSAESMQVIDGFLLTLMRNIVRDLTDHKFLLQEVAGEENTENVLSASAIEKAIAYINVHYAGSLCLEDVARRFFFSRSRFTRSFREHTGQSFLEYLNARRMEQARRLLTETDWTAALITRYVGFSSPAYFHRLFVRETGMTPMQYRQEQRGE